MSFGEITNRICSEAVANGCGDNVTLMIINLKEYYMNYHKKQIHDANSINLKFPSNPTQSRQNWRSKLGAGIVFTDQAYF